MTTTLITGAAGFTGRYLAKRLADQGHKVVGLLREPAKLMEEGVSETHVCDLANSAGLQGVLHQVQPDHVVHLAAIAFVKFNVRSHAVALGICARHHQCFR